MFKDIKREEEELSIELEPIDKLKKIIAATRETRVTELGGLMKIGNNTVHELIEELIEELVEEE